MGEIADWMIDQMLWGTSNYGQETWSDKVNEYTGTLENKALMLEARELLSEEIKTIDTPTADKIRSILQFGIIHGRLSDKQRYALGEFILTLCG